MQKYFVYQLLYFQKKCCLPELFICKFYNNKEVKMCRKIVQKNVFCIELPFAKIIIYKIFHLQKITVARKNFSFAKKWLSQKLSFAETWYCVREGFKKSKWKFKMAFAMKGRGGSRPVSSATYLCLKNDFFKNHLESFPDCENVFCT